MILSCAKECGTREEGEKDEKVESKRKGKHEGRVRSLRRSAHCFPVLSASSSHSLQNHLCKVCINISLETETDRYVSKVGLRDFMVSSYRKPSLCGASAIYLAGGRQRQRQLLRALSPVLLSSGLGPGKLVSPGILFKSTNGHSSSFGMVGSELGGRPQQTEFTVTMK